MKKRHILLGLVALLIGGGIAGAGVVSSTQPVAVTAAAAQGPWLARRGFARVTHPGYPAWSSFAFTKHTKLAQNQLVKINGQYHHANGATYASIYTLSGKWLGYINDKALKTATNLEGTKLADNRYVTVMRRADTYANFNFTRLHAAADVYQHTYHSVAQYRHADGNTYLALENAAGQFMGYINQNAVTVAHGAQGAWLKANLYTNCSGNVVTYSDFGLSRVKASGAALNGRLAHITGMYRRFDGTLLYSLYNNKNQWLGYANAASVKLSGAQGPWQAASGYFATTKAGVTLWSSFNFSHGQSTSSGAYYRHTYQITGVYHHFNGSTYYSLQDGNGRWVGYVNAAFGAKTSGPQGQWYPSSGRYIVAKTGYPIWHGFFTNRVATTTALHGKIYSVTGVYRHLNGSLYDSLYNGKTWIGYVNAAAMAPYVAYHDWLKPSQTYAYPNLNKYANINIEANLTKQQVYIKNGNTILYTMYCSSGANNTTPKGHFRIQNRGASFYNPSEGMGARYWTSFKDWGVYLFHSVPTNRNGNYIPAAAKLLGVRPDSHGCIRLSVPDAKWINTYIKQGTPVYIH